MPVGARDFYEVLGVPRDAGTDDIRSAYRTLARKNHPDINKDPDAEDRFKEIAEAYEVLRDPDRRARYDRRGDGGRAGRDVPGADGFDGFSGFGGAGFDGAGFDRGEDFGDLFESLFGGRRGGAGGQGFRMPRRGPDHEATLELTLEEAARGGHRHLAFEGGQEYDVDIPAGVRDGQRIRLSGEGGPGVDDGPPGDLLLRVHIAPHRRFTRRGDDLDVDVDVSPSEAALGARIPVPTLTGTARVTLPAGSASGRRLRLRGEGMPSIGGGTGDLYARVRIVVPRDLTDRQRELYEQLAASGSDPREARR